MAEVVKSRDELDKMLFHGHRYVTLKVEYGELADCANDAATHDYRLHSWHWWSPGESNMVVAVFESATSVE